MLFQYCEECQRIITEHEADASRLITEKNFGTAKCLCSECRRTRFVRGSELGVTVFDML